MDPALRLKRHTQLWKDGESQARRIGIGGAVFSLLILLTVIEPFYIQSSETRTELAAKRPLEAKIKAEQGSIARLEKQFAAVIEVIEEKPWTDEIEGLKAQFRNGQITDPGEQSNAALRDIADELKQTVVVPLGEAAQGLDANHPLAAIARDVDSQIESWYDRHAETTWWRSTVSKDNTAADIGAEIDIVMLDALNMAELAKAELAMRAADASQQLEALLADIASLSKELTGVMNRALPAWARGIIEVDDLLIVFPLLLAGIAAYLMTTAVTTSRHFHAMADGEGWSAEDRRDPLLSSAWTLTARGARGTAATAVTYGMVLAVLAICLYRSQNPPVTQQASSIETSIGLIATVSNTTATISYAVIAVALAALVGVLYKGRRQASGEPADHSDLA